MFIIQLMTDPLLIPNIHKEKIVTSISVHAWKSQNDNTQFLMYKSHSTDRKCEKSQLSLKVASALLTLFACAKVKAVSVASLIFVALL